MFEVFGSYIKILGRMIPAVNIRVEGVPGWIPCTERPGVKYWYGVYFEILWEDASLWVVEMGSKQEQPGLLTLREYRNWGTGIGKPIEGPMVVLRSTDELISVYDEKRLMF